jgi:DHA1 family tetracycline resistance protein-like MFS transporter
VLDMLALGAVLPVLPRLVLQFLGGDSASAARVYVLMALAPTLGWPGRPSSWRRP